MKWFHSNFAKNVGLKMPSDEIDKLKKRILRLEEGLKHVRNAAHCTSVEKIAEMCNEYLKEKK